MPYSAGAGILIQRPNVIKLLTNSDTLIRLGAYILVLKNLANDYDGGRRI